MSTDEIYSEYPPMVRSFDDQFFVADTAEQQRAYDLYQEEEHEKWRIARYEREKHNIPELKIMDWMGPMEILNVMRILSSRRSLAEIHEDYVESDYIEEPAGPATFGSLWHVRGSTVCIQ